MAVSNLIMGAINALSPSPVLAVSDFLVALHLLFETRILGLAAVDDVGLIVGEHWKMMNLLASR